MSRSPVRFFAAAARANRRAQIVLSGAFIRPNIPSPVDEAGRIPPVQRSTFPPYFPQPPRPCFFLKAEAGFDRCLLVLSHSIRAFFSLGKPREQSFDCSTRPTDSQGRSFHARFFPEKRFKGLCCSPPPPPPFNLPPRQPHPPPLFPLSPPQTRIPTRIQVRPPTFCFCSGRNPPFLMPTCLYPSGGRFLNSWYAFEDHKSADAFFLRPIAFSSSLEVALHLLPSFLSPNPSEMATAPQIFPPAPAPSVDCT